MRDIADLPEGVYLNEQLIGSAVICEGNDFSGDLFGFVESIIATKGRYRLLSVRREGGEVLVPFVKSVVVSVDPNARTIRVRRVDGVTA